MELPEPDPTSSGISDDASGPVEATELEADSLAVTSKSATSGPTNGRLASSVGPSPQKPSERRAAIAAAWSNDRLASG